MSKKLSRWSKFSGNLKQVLMSVGIGLLNIVVAAALGLVLLILVYKLPLENITGNVEKSALIMDNEGTYPQVFSWCTSQLDNFTDSIMLLEATDETDDSALNKALMAYRGGIDGKNPQESLVEHFAGEEEYTNTIEYPRYWHGYNLLLKPLLGILDYGKLRIINGITQALIFLIICMLLWKRELKHLIIPYFICYLMLMPVALAMSFQFSSCYYIDSIGMVMLLAISEKNRNAYAWLVFLNIGILTAYFDFLTYPIATFGVPAVLLLAMTSQDKTEIRLRNMAGNGIAWCAGYGGMWFSKWVLTAIFTDYKIFENAFTAFSSRVSLTAPDGETKYSIFRCILDNYRVFFKTPFSILFLIVILYLLLYIRNKHYYGTMRIIIPYAILGLAPAVWFCFATSHSAIHVFFTNKCCVVSVMAIMFGFAESFDFIRRSSEK